jgi:hypothetical protein
VSDAADSPKVIKTVIGVPPEAVSQHAGSRGFFRWWAEPTRVPRVFVYYAIAVAFIGFPRGVSNWFGWLT